MLYDCNKFKLRYFPVSLIQYVKTNSTKSAITLVSVQQQVKQETV